jgi:hypothetical protein
MRDERNIIEVEAGVACEGHPDDYFLARELALAGSHEEAKRIYYRLLAETATPSLQALVYNDLAAVAATAGETQSGNQLLTQALEFHPECEAALENWSALGERGRAQTGVQAHFCFADSAKMCQSPGGRPVPNSGFSSLPIYGFMHVGVINHWRDIVEEQLLKLHASGLWDRTERIFVGLVGPQHEEFDFKDEKVEVVYRGTDFQEAEYPTLKALQQFCASHDCLVYYIHTKGNFHVSDNTRDWRHLMEHFVIQRHEDCIRTLGEHDACGVNLLTERGTVPFMLADSQKLGQSPAALSADLEKLGQSPTPAQAFFAGNFWWARSDYIRTLPPISSLAPNGSRPDRYTCERWIGMNRRARLASLHQCPVDQYHNRYARSNYARIAEVPPCPALATPSARDCPLRRGAHHVHL